MEDSLKQKMINSTAWSFIDRFGQQGMQFIIGIVLARLLSPNDYGLLGMIMIFFAISFAFVDMGLSKALIRKKEIEDVYSNTVFWSNLLIALFLYLLLYISTPFIASFFNQPALIPIARVSFISIIFVALYIVPYSLLNKKMDFKTITKISISSTLISGIIGISLAFAGFGVWSLVVQQITYQFLRFVLSFLYVKWLPKLLFSCTVIREVWSFSVHIFSTVLLTTLFNNLYVFLLGKFYSIQQTGYYTQANRMNETVNFSFQAILNNTYNLFVQIQDQTERLRHVFRIMTKKISLFYIPMLCLLIVTAKPLFFILFSEKWLLSVAYFQLLCLANLFSPFVGTATHLLNARGRSKSAFMIELSKRVLIVFSVFICFQYGITGLLTGYAAANLISTVFTFYLLKQEIAYYYKQQIKDIAPSILLGSIIALSASILMPFIQNLYLLFTAQILTGGILYIALLHLFFRESFIEAISYAKTLVKRLH